MRERYGERVFAAEVGINVRLAELPGIGRDIFELDPAARGARAYLAVATELVRRAKGDTPRPDAPPCPPVEPPAPDSPAPAPEPGAPRQIDLLEAESPPHQPSPAAD